MVVETVQAYSLYLCQIFMLQSQIFQKLGQCRLSHCRRRRQKYDQSPAQFFLHPGELSQHGQKNGFYGFPAVNRIDLKSVDIKHILFPIFHDLPH